MSDLISVIMGIYNNETTLKEALDSLLAQTYQNFEVIMCDDASTDETYTIAREYVDKYPKKFVLFKNEKNMGLNFTLNKCLKSASGDYIARMDGDDISCPDRFKKELDAFKTNPDISIVSTDMEFFDVSGVWGKTNAKQTPQKSDFLYNTQFCHAACLVKKEAYLAVDGYTVSKKLLRVEDYHLWIKMYEKGFVGINIQEPLYKMRDDRNAVNRRKFKYRLNEAYVKAYAVKHLKLPFYAYIFCIKPIILGLLPKFIYSLLHKTKNANT